MKRRTFIAAAGATALLASCSRPDFVELYDYKIGNPDAQVKIIEYFSLSCGHCARFHNQSMPLLKRDYIDMGLVELTLREVYFDQMALKVSAALREGEYLSDLDRHFAAFPNNMAPLMQEYKLKYETVDPQMVENYRRAAEHNVIADAIEATPTFVFSDDGGRVRGNDYDKLVKEIKKRFQ